MTFTQMDVWNPTEGAYQKSFVPGALAELYEQAEKELGHFSRVRLSRKANKIILEIETVIQ